MDIYTPLMHLLGDPSWISKGLFLADCGVICVLIKVLNRINNLETQLKDLDRMVNQRIDDLK